MKILVTGGSGFTGSNFILNQLDKTKNEIFNLDLLTYAGNEDNLKHCHENKNYMFKKGDICNKNTIESIFSDFLPDILINFAAESHVDRSIDNPTNFIQTNIFGTFNLLNISLDYFKSHTKFKFIQISTDEVYGSLDLNDDPFLENNAYEPSSPYSASKASSDHLAMSWHRTFGLPVIISNCSNNFGPYQFPEKLIPLVIANCIDQKPLPIYGDGQNIRDWLYVYDHCEAINFIIEKGEVGEKYNIGGNNEIKNIDIVEEICTILDNLCPQKSGMPYKDLITYVEDRPGHDFRYAIDSSKIQQKLGWKPKESFQKNLSKTIRWYLKNESWWRQIQKETYQQQRLGIKNS